MKGNPKRRKWILAIAVPVLAVAVGAGIWFVARGSGEPVNVFSFRYIGMTEYWGDSQESYGPVSTDKIQTVFLTETQIVTEISVKEGEMVKKGDLLMTFDTTLSDIAVERERLNVEKLKLQKEAAEERLWEIRNMEPMIIPEYDDDFSGGNIDRGKPLKDAYRISNKLDHDGSSTGKALICWLHGNTSVDDTLLETLRQSAEELQNKNAQLEPSSASDIPQLPTETQDVQPITEESLPETTEGETEPTEEEPEPEKPPYIHVNDYYVIFKVTHENMSLGERQVWQGMHVTRKDSGFRYQFFDASWIDDPTVSDPNVYDTEPEIDYGSGYTAAQIAQMASEQEKKIKDLEFDIKMAEAEYKITLTEVSDGSVYAEVDGKVVSVLTEEEAKLQHQPILKVSGGGGFYIEGSVSELEKDNLRLGQEVTINDWNTGMTYTGKITSMGDFPSSRDGWNGIGNPNVSYYPFTAFVDESADLQAGMYASIQFSAGSTEHGIYLENPFIRTEQGNSYVYLRGADGRLEKRYVTVGKSLWGNYKEILSGLTEEDFIAFPYGKTVKEGAQTVESDLSALYEY